MRDILTRLAKLESTAGARPFYVRFTDPQGQARKMPLHEFICRLREFISLVQFEAREIPHTIPPEAAFITACVGSAVKEQLQGVTGQGALPAIACQLMDLLQDGYMYMGEGKYYLLTGDTVKLQGGTLCESL